MHPFAAAARAFLLTLILLAGCATEETAVLSFDPSPSAQAGRIVFPPPGTGEIPRYQYVGELVGEQNFVHPGGRKGNALITSLRWLAGLFETEDAVVLQRPQAGVADDLGRILVTDVSRGAVYVFDQVRGRLDVWEGADESRRFLSPSGIALGPEGRVFVSDADLRTVFLLDREGKGSRVVGEDQLLRPHGLAWDTRTALLYVSDTLSHQIKVFDPAGRLVRILGRRGEGPGEYNFPTHLALSRGKLYVSDTMNARIQVVSPEDGRAELVFGERGSQVGSLIRPKGVAVDTEHNIYVVESYHDHLLVFDPQGNFLLPIGGTGKNVGNFYLPGGVWADARNRIYVADTFNGRVVIFQFLGGGVKK